MVVAFSWTLSGLLSAEIFISTGGPDANNDRGNSQFLQSGSQEVSLVMGCMPKKSRSGKILLPLGNLSYCLHKTKGTINDTSTSAPGIGRESIQKKGKLQKSLYWNLQIAHKLCVTNVLSKTPLICNSQLFLCINSAWPSMHMYIIEDLYDFYLFLSEFIPKPDGWICFHFLPPELVMLLMGPIALIVTHADRNHKKYQKIS